MPSCPPRKHYCQIVSVVPSDLSLHRVTRMNACAVGSDSSRPDGARRWRMPFPPRTVADESNNRRWPQDLLDCSPTTRIVPGV
jgi:hypothetical protein